MREMATISMQKPFPDGSGNNVAPNVSLAWRPNVQDGFLRTLLGDPENAVLRGGYSVAYDRQGISAFTGVSRAMPVAGLP